jgi:hypothetical protein
VVVFIEVLPTPFVAVIVKVHGPFPVAATVVPEVMAVGPVVAEPLLDEV